jgi:hypothetical protein
LHVWAVVAGPDEVVRVRRDPATQAVDELAAGVDVTDVVRLELRWSALEPATAARAILTLYLSVLVETPSRWVSDANVLLSKPKVLRASLSVSRS